MQILYRYFLLITASAISTLSSGISLADTLILETKVFSSSNNLGMPIHRASKTPLQIVISDKGWKMTHVERSSTVEIGSEGADVYCLFKDHNTGICSGEVTSFKFPIRGYFYQLPWLAYCTAFFDEGELVALPPWRRSDHPEAHTFDAEIEFSEGFPHLPKLIQWRGNKAKSKTAKNNSPFIRKRFLGSEQLETLRNWKFRMPDGFVSGVYQVEKFTNVGGWEIPESANLEVREYLGEQNGKAEWKVVANFRIELLDAKILQKEEEDFLPEITSLTSVSDYRINPKDSWPAHYRTKDSWIINTNDPVLVESYHKMQSKMNRSRILNYFGSRIPLIIQSLIFVLILVFIYRKRGRNLIDGDKSPNLARY